MTPSIRSTIIKSTIKDFSLHSSKTIPVSKSSLCTLFGTALLLLQSDITFGVGLDQLEDLNGPQDAAADIIQGPDVGGTRPAPAPENTLGLCPNISTASSNPAESALATRCTELVVSADPSGTGGAGSAFDLGMAPEQVKSALQQVVPEETEIIGAGATDTSHDQLTNVKDRLQFLRTAIRTQSVVGMHFGNSLDEGAAAADGSSRWGSFINAGYGTGEKDPTFNETGFDYDAYAITIGSDYRFNDNLVAGLALGVTKSDVTIDQGAGEYETDGENIALYGLYNGAWIEEGWLKQSQFYVEGVLTRGVFDYEGQRDINYGSGASSVIRTAESTTDGDQWAWSLAAGVSAQRESWHFNFYGRAEGVDADIDAYDETGSGNSTVPTGNEWAVHVNKQELESRQLILGAQAAYAASQTFGVLQPYASLEAHHEFDDEARTITAFYRADPFFAADDPRFPILIQTDDADKDFFLMTLGITLALQEGNQLFLNYDTLLALEDVESHVISAGLRFEL